MWILGVFTRAGGNGAQVASKETFYALWPVMWLDIQPFVIPTGPGHGTKEGAQSPAPGVSPGALSSFRVGSGIPQTCWPFLELVWETLTLLRRAEVAEQVGRVFASAHWEH